VTYFGFLARFIILPLIALRILIHKDRKHGQSLPNEMQSWRENDVLIGHVITAVTYTTPWDNYLVASNVWAYDTDLVTGHTIGWVPIEEYTFFVLQSLLTGSWWQYLAPRIHAENREFHPDLTVRVFSTGGLGLIWGTSLINLLFGKDKHRYMNLILSWSLPPIMLQTAIGGDILWHHRTLIASSILPATAYLGLTDSLAIQSGTWTITPEKTVQKEIIPNLPLEELLFFFVTNVLLVFGMTLVHAKASEGRLPDFIKPYYNRLKVQLQSVES